MPGQTSYYGKLLRPEIDGGKKATILTGRARFKSSAKVVTLGVPFTNGVLGFSYGWYITPTFKGKHLQTSGLIHASAVTMSAGTGMGAGEKFARNIRVSRLTGGTGSSAASFWYKVIGW